MKRSAVRCAIAAALLLDGCADAGQPGHTFDVVEEDGVRVALNSAVPRYGGELFSYEKVVEIRPDPAVEDSYLYGPSAMTVDDEELVYVAERGNFRVSVWDLDGNYLRSIGSRGEGPGEFPFGPMAAIDVRDGVLSVPMLPNGRTLRFDTDGTYIDTLSYAGARSPMSINEGPGGELVVIEHEPQDQRAELYGARATVVGSNDQVLAILEAPMVRSINFSGFAEAVFVPPDEVLLTTGEDPVLRWYGLDGAVRREVRFDLAPDPVTRLDRGEIEAYIDQRIADAPESRDEPGAEAGTKDRWRGTRERLAFPETKAHWAGILASDTGWVWLIKPRPEKFDYTINEVWAALVINPEGRYIGDTTMPALFAPGGVKGDLFLAMVIDVDTGERIPTVFRLRPNVAGLVFP